MKNKLLEPEIFRFVILQLLTETCIKRSWYHTNSAQFVFFFVSISFLGNQSKLVKFSKKLDPGCMSHNVITIDPDHYCFIDSILYQIIIIQQFHRTATYNTARDLVMVRSPPQTTHFNSPAFAIVAHQRSRPPPAATTRTCPPHHKNVTSGENPIDRYAARGASVLTAWPPSVRPIHRLRLFRTGPVVPPSPSTTRNLRNLLRRGRAKRARTHVNRGDSRSTRGMVGKCGMPRQRQDIDRVITCSCMRVRACERTGVTLTIAPDEHARTHSHVSTTIDSNFRQRSSNRPGERACERARLSASGRTAYVRAAATGSDRTGAVGHPTARYAVLVSITGK